MVEQSPVLFSGSIAYNIGYGMVSDAAFRMLSFFNANYNNGSHMPAERILKMQLEWHFLMNLLRAWQMGMIHR